MFQCFNVSLKQNACLGFFAGFLCNIWQRGLKGLGKVLLKVSDRSLDQIGHKLSFEHAQKTDCD